MASQVASAVVYLLARHAGLAVDFQSQSILTILVFGVGVDYALLLLARYREELRRHSDRHRAMAQALRRSFSAIAASAATVSLGLLCLLAADLPATRGLGPVCFVGVLAAFAVMTTLLPALVVLCGRWAFWPFVPHVGDSVESASGLATHRRGRRSLAAGDLARHRGGPAGAHRRESAGSAWAYPADKSFTKEVGSVTGQHLIEAHYAAGTASPAVDHRLVPLGRAGGRSGHRHTGREPKYSRLRHRPTGNGYASARSCPTRPSRTPLCPQWSACGTRCTPYPAATRWSAATPL